MGIKEAVTQAMRLRGVIYRPQNTDGGKIINAIRPTNSYDCCQALCSDLNGHRGSIRWNPTADDLMANDWEVAERWEDGD